MFKLNLKYSFQIALIAVLAFGFFSAEGQTSSYDLPLTQTAPLQRTLVNPAAQVKSTLEFKGNYHAFLGSFSDVNHTLLLINYKLKESRAIGGYFANEKTSDFFSRTRLYLSYQEQIELSKNTILSAGIKIGAVNFVMEPVGFTTGGSDWGADLSAGLELATTNFTLGVAAHQLPNTILQPILFEFELNRFFDLYSSYVITLTPKITYEPEIRVRLNTLNDIYMISNVISYDEKHGVNVSLSMTEGMIFQGFITYKTNNGHMSRLICSFFQPLQVSLKKLNAQQFEMGLNIDLGNPSK